MPESFETSTGLRQYQTIGVARTLGVLQTLSCAILADEMGLGKTREACCVTNNISGRKLIICPASVRIQWQKELEILGYTNYILIDPYVHIKLKKNKIDKLDQTFVITSYDLAAKVYNYFFKQAPPEIIILDEAHNLRGRGNDRQGNIRTKGIKQLCTLSNFKLAVTGTPLWDRPKDLWMLFQILGVKLSTWDFDIRYCNGSLNDYGGMENKGSSNEEELKLRLSYYMVRRLKKDIAKELPPLTRQVEWLDPTPNSTNAWIGSMATPGAGSLANALKACHDAKLGRAIELAIEARRFLLFTYRREHAEYLASKIQEQGITCSFIHGGQDSKQRQAIIDNARTAQTGLICTIDSVGTGVNLQNIATVGIVHALPWEPNKLLQMEARPHRIDTHEPFNWIYLAIRESADEHVITAIVNKLETWQNIMGMTESDKGLKDALADSKPSIELERSVLRAVFDSMEI